MNYICESYTTLMPLIKIAPCSGLWSRFRSDRYVFEAPGISGNGSVSRLLGNRHMAISVTE